MPTDGRKRAQPTAAERIRQARTQAHLLPHGRATSTGPRARRDALLQALAASNGPRQAARDAVDALAGRHPRLERPLRGLSARIAASSAFQIPPE